MNNEKTYEQQLDEFDNNVDAALSSFPNFDELEIFQNDYMSHTGKLSELESALAVMQPREELVRCAGMLSNSINQLKRKFQVARQYAKQGLIADIKIKEGEARSLKQKIAKEEIAEIAESLAYKIISEETALKQLIYWSH